MGMENKIAALVGEVHGDAPVGATDYDKPLKDLGLDSLDIASLFLAISEQLGVRVPDQDIDRLDTVSAIAAYLEQKR
jgi:acyl carrier protein